MVGDVEGDPSDYADEQAKPQQMSRLPDAGKDEHEDQSEYQNHALTVGTRWAIPSTRSSSVVSGGAPRKQRHRDSTTNGEFRMAAIAELMAERDALANSLSGDELEGQALDDAVTRATEISAEIDSHNQRVQRANEARGRLASASSVIAPEGGIKRADDILPSGHMTQRQAVQQIHQSRSFQDFISGGGRGSASVELDEEATNAIFGRVFKRTLLGGGSALAADLVIPTPLPGIAEALRRPLRVADLFDRQTSTAGALAYVRDTSATPQGLASTVAPGAQKPESAYTFEIVSVPFSKIAHILPVVQEAIDDVTQLEGYLSGQMTYGVEYQLDAELINGPGTSGRIDGLINLGTPDVAPGSEEPILSIRHAKTKAQQANVNEANLSVVINPEDWDLVETALASTSGVFLSGTAAFAGVGPRIWGMPVVVTNACPDGTVIVGDFTSSTLWERQSATVSISDSNQNYFELNILTLRAELRAALQVPQPKRFIVVTLGK